MARIVCVQLNRVRHSVRSESGASVPTADVWELNTQSFLIRLWIEEPATATHKAIWRGHITHIPPIAVPPEGRGIDPSAQTPLTLAPGTRRYVQSLSDITEFLAAFLRQMDAGI